MYKQIYASATNVNNILNVQVSTSHSNPVSVCSINCENHSLSLGNKVDVYLGYTGNYGKVFSGYVKEITRSIPDDTYTIVLNDIMQRAVDYFIAPENPDEPFTRMNIEAENLVRDIMALAGLINYYGEATYFIFGINNPVEVKLVSAYDFCRSIADLLAFHLYADEDDKIWFVRRLPYPTSSDSAHISLNSNSQLFLSSVYGYDANNLRNRVVVYGANGVSAEAKASSPYLPEGFYKTVVYGSSILVHSQDMANTIASYNLDVLNRLTYKLSITIEGDFNYKARQIVNVTDTFQGINNQLWYAFSVEHYFSKSEGYTTHLELRR